MARYSNNLDRCSLKRFHTNKTTMQSFSLSLSRHFFPFLFLSSSVASTAIHRRVRSVINIYRSVAFFPARDPGLRARPEYSSS